MIIYVVAVGCAGGAVFYAIAAARRKTPWSIEAGEAVTSGGLLAGACHLFYCVFNPGFLVEVFHEDGTAFHLDHMIVKLDSMHALEIMVGAAVAAYFPIRALISIWKHPG